MNRLPFLSALMICFSAIGVNAEESDFTERKNTDPLLRIASSSSLLPEKDDKWLRAKRDENHIPPVYKRIWSRQNVIMLEPFSREKPAEIDFSAITKENVGVLRILARNDPRGDFLLEITKGDQSVEKESIGADKWKRFTIPFDHENVKVFCRANGWSFEFGFIDYSFARSQ